MKVPGRATWATLAALVAALVAFRLHLPLWLVAAVATGVWFGVQALLPRPHGGELLDDARAETARALIEDGAVALDRLRSAGARMQDPEMRASVDRLAATAGRVLAEVRTAPAKAMGVRRLLTFYLPTAASLAEGWRSLEDRRTPSPERLAQTHETLLALNDAFDRFADELDAPRLETLDVDLRLLNDALNADLDRSA